MKSIGLIGIGQMGMPMGKNLLRAGYDLTVYARRVDAALPLQQLGAKLVKSPKLVSENCEAIVLALPAPQDVIDIIFGNEAIVSGLTSGKAIIDTSTLDPKSSREIAKRLDINGVDYLDSPVSGGPEGSTKASLTFMIGGRKEGFEKCNEIFKVLGKNIFYMGESGSGTAAKLVNQLLVSSNTLASAEAMQLANALSLDSGQIIEVISTSAGDSFAFRRVSRKIAEKEFGEGWQTYLLEKDLKLLLATSSDLGLPSISAETSLEVFSKAVNAGLGKVDAASVIKILDQLKD